MTKNKNSKKIKKIVKKPCFFKSIKKASEDIRQLFETLNEIDKAAYFLSDECLLDKEPAEVLCEYLRYYEDQQTVISYLKLQEATGYSFVEMSVEDYKSEVGYTDESADIAY